MELARQLAMDIIKAKTEAEKNNLWALKCAKESEPIRSLVRTLVLRFHENIEPLKYPLGGGEGGDADASQKTSSHEGEITVSR